MLRAEGKGVREIAREIGQALPHAEIEALYAPRSETNISLNMKRGSQLTRSP